MPRLNLLTVYLNQGKVIGTILEKESTIYQRAIWAYMNVICREDPHTRDLFETGCNCGQLHALNGALATLPQ